MQTKQTPLRLLVLCMLLMFSSGIFAQSRVVTGKVTDANNQPVANASVTVKGSRVGTNTDENGNYSISVPSNRNTLVVSYVGFEDRSVTVSGNTANIQISGRTTTLNDVIVTGYTTQRKKELTGAVAVVNVASMKQIPTGTGEEALQGQASGVTIITSGQPGYGSDIRIRGFSGTGGSRPLIIVDGIEGDLTNINPQDIESLQVLKDASASIYGLRGSNGVVIITTKKGKSGKAKVSYDAYYGYQEPGKGFQMASPQEEANALFQKEINSGNPNPGTKLKQYGNGPTPVLPYYIVPTGAALGDPRADPSKYDINSNQIMIANQAGTDWYHTIFKQAVTQSHNIQVSGGSDKSSYLFGLNYLDQQGILLSTQLKRYAVRANTQFSIKDHIRLGENAYIFYKTNPSIGNQNEGNPISYAYRESSLIPVYDIMGNYGGTKAEDFGNSSNPFAIVDRRNKYNKGNDWQVQGNVFADVDFARHFDIRTTFGGSIDNYYYYSFSPTAYENAEGNTNPNSFNEGAGYNSNWTWNNVLTYSNLFGKHNVKVLVGTEAINHFGRGVSGTRGPYFSTDPNFLTLDAGAPLGETNSGSPYQSTLFSQFARADYSFNEKYYINGTVRRDGASVFAPGHRISVFPSVSAAWRVSQENFMKGISWLSDLKLRYSWGKLGSISGVNGNNQYTLYSSNIARSYYDINGTSNSPRQGFFQSQAGNKLTTFEGDIIENYGLDLSAFKSKLEFTFEYYKKTNSGLLFALPFADVYGGANAPAINFGNVQTKGVDMSASYHGTLKNGFKYDVRGTYTSYRNLVLSLPNHFKDFLPNDGSTRIGRFERIEEGHPLGQFYGYKVIGLFQDAADVAKSPTQDGAGIGRFKYQDVNGDGKIDDNDRTYIGDPNPKFTMGLNIALSYKNFDFSTFLFGSFGNTIANYTKYFTDFPQVFKGGIRREAAINSFSATNKNATIPILENAANTSNTGVFNSYYLESGNYLRSKQMQLGYTFGNKDLSRYGIDRLRLYVQAANLFTITKYDGLDPELQSNSENGRQGQAFGVDFGNYPHTRQYLIGINLGF